MWLGWSQVQEPVLALALTCDVCANEDKPLKANLFSEVLARGIFLRLGGIVSIQRMWA